MENSKIVYFTNDQFQIVENEMARFREDPSSYYEMSSITPDEVVLSIIEYLKTDTIEDVEVDKKVRNLIRSMDTMLDFSTEEELDKFDALLETLPKDSKCFQQLCKEYEDLLWNNYYFISDRLDFDREVANDNMAYDGFCPDTYIILGSNMGWRHLHGYNIKNIKNVKDMEAAVTGNYDYTIEISRPSAEAPYLEACVSTHDSMGERYILIPLSRLKDALKYPEVKEEYKKFAFSIKEDLADAG